ncbi:MAG: hypothetical protein ACRDVN_12900 [Jiangellaceae bacterium]
MHRTTGIIAATALVFVAASCGSPADRTAANDEVSTTAIGTGNGGGSELFAAMAEAQEKSGSYRFESHADAQEIYISGVASQGLDASQFDFAVDARVPLRRIGVRSPGVGEIGVRLVDGELFLRLPPEVELPTERAWLTLDPSDSDPFSRQFGAMAEGLVGIDLAEHFAAKSELIAVEKFGSKAVDGVELTEYRLIIDVGDVAEYEGLLPGEGSPVEGRTHTLFVSAENLLHSATIDLGEFGTSEVRYFDYGGDALVEAPPIDEVADVRDMLDELDGFFEL